MSTKLTRVPNLFHRFSRPKKAKTFKKKLWKEKKKKQHHFGNQWQSSQPGIEELGLWKMQYKIAFFIVKPVWFQKNLVDNTKGEKSLGIKLNAMTLAMF